MDVLQIQTLVILLLIILLGNHTRVQIQVHLCYITFSAIRCEFCNGYYTNEGSIGLIIRANELLTSTNNTVDQLEKLFNSDCSVTPLIGKEIGALVSTKKKSC